mmetsp:Transcript_21130/g.47913  ORF Transcript_21130/g.47913 Transcript_21130/m.47913 type:complete len:275 (-) Transcript_21130:542-1366(-)
MVSRERFEMKFSSFVRRPQAEAVVLVPGGALHVQRLRRERILGVGVERAPVLALSRKDDGVPGGQHPDEFVRPRKVFVQGAVVRVALVRPPGDLAVFAVTVGFEQLRVPIVIGREEKRLNEFVVSEATRGFRNSFARAAYLARTARRAVRQRCSRVAEGRTLQQFSTVGPKRGRKRSTNVNVRTFCNLPATPALTPFTDMNVRTGGSLYLAIYPRTMLQPWLKPIASNPSAVRGSERTCSAKASTVSSMLTRKLAMTSLFRVSPWGTHHVALPV